MIFKSLKKRIAENVEENSHVMEDRLNEAIRELADDVILTQREYKAICTLLYAMQYEDIPLQLETIHKLNVIRTEQGLAFPTL